MAVALVLVGVLLVASGLMLLTPSAALVWLGLAGIAAGLFAPEEALRRDQADRPAAPPGR